MPRQPAAGAASDESADRDADDTVAWPVLEDEDLAGRSSARLLISATVIGEAEARARRIHRLGCRRQGPFVRTDAGDFPTDEPTLRLMCVDLLRHATGGTLFIDAVDTMPASVQSVFVELIDGLGPRADSSRAVRLVSGTAVSLLERVAAGRFAERLFYRLNVLHLTPAGGAQALPTTCESGGESEAVAATDRTTRATATSPP